MCHSSGRWIPQQYKYDLEMIVIVIASERKNMEVFPTFK